MMAMDELSMVVRRAIAHTATQYEMSIVQFSHWIRKRPPSIQADLIGLSGVRNVGNAIGKVVTLFIGEESQVEFDAERYTELANSGMSNIAIAREMGFNSDAGMRYQAVRAGVYQKNPSGAPMKAEKDKLSPAEKELVKQLSNANVGKVDGDGFNPMTVTIAKESAQESVDKVAYEQVTNLTASVAPGDVPALVGKMALKNMLKERCEIAVTPPPDNVVPVGKVGYITIRIPFERKTPKADYADKDARKKWLKNGVDTLKIVIDSVNEDIIDLLGAEDVERVQAYIDRHIG